MENILIKEEYSILVVEDEFISLEYLKDILLRIGFVKIFTVRNPDEAISIARQNKIDLIFMDINLNSSIDGIACAKIINQEKKIPVVYTTANSDTKTIQKAISSYTLGYIIKPFGIEDVESALNNVFKFANSKY